MRSQLFRTDKMVYQTTLSPANENPAVNIAASAPAAITLRTVRNADGSVAGGVVIFDVNPRFPAGTTFTGMHIHDGAADKNGPVTIDTEPEIFPDSHRRRHRQHVPDRHGPH